ncbi:hypothetical protein BV25DRAFT_1818255 [Artomyces pyxidatus]|uniref:Uncharacterized protein n=1 Tax=Artomyces pyxidatus TaxID=48021 RepID=A0ACB8TLI5_9AGAM|nr:hypothetical protein BV25DRAFT_1818255 [Artomyces pyxidatus]
MFPDLGDYSQGATSTTSNDPLPQVGNHTPASIHPATNESDFEQLPMNHMPLYGPPHTGLAFSSGLSNRTYAVHRRISSVPSLYPDVRSPSTVEEHRQQPQGLTEDTGIPNSLAQHATSRSGDAQSYKSLYPPSRVPINPDPRAELENQRDASSRALPQSSATRKRSRAIAETDDEPVATETQTTRGTTQTPNATKGSSMRRTKRKLDPLSLADSPLDPGDAPEQETIQTFPASTRNAGVGGDSSTQDNIHRNTLTKEELRKQKNAASSYRHRAREKEVFGATRELLGIPKSWSKFRAEEYILEHLQTAMARQDSLRGAFMAEIESRDITISTVSLQLSEKTKECREKDAALEEMRTRCIALEEELEKAELIIRSMPLIDHRTSNT